MNQQPKYRRILLKLSGEALANGQKDSILDFTFIDQIAAVLKKCLVPCLIVIVWAILFIVFANVLEPFIILG